MRGLTPHAAHSAYSKTPYVAIMRAYPGPSVATREALIAAFCRLDKSLSCCWEKGWLVGAVGIEIEVHFHKS